MVLRGGRWADRRRGLRKRISCGAHFQLCGVRENGLPADTICFMQGKPKVIALLNEALKEELTAISQYFLHAEMCENWHYEKLGDFIKKQSIDEMKHAEALIERILFLDATPTMGDALQLSVGKNVKEQLESDLKLEISAVGLYNRAAETARTEGDNASRELFERLLKDEEEHVDWLEAQLFQIGEMGYERYLSQQIRDEK
ncbi:MAG TPA: bacterioferritin [Bryobacteraceae bacterium]|nr:bacterioferritin [Bryobacteraceae bacterium]